MSFDKKGQMSAAVAGMTALATVIVLIVVIGLISAYGSRILQDTESEIATDGCNTQQGVYDSGTHTLHYNQSTGYCENANRSVLLSPNLLSVNNTISGNEAVGNLTQKMPTLATVLIGAFIILILISAFAVFGLGKS